MEQGSRAFEGRCVPERAIRAIPVLVVTRCYDLECYLKAMELGAVDYLEEPVDVPELVRLITGHLRS